VTLTGGGLSTQRTMSLDQIDYALPSWAATDAAVAAAADAVATASAAQTERELWAVQLPIALGVAALVLAAFGLRSRRRALSTLSPDTHPTLNTGLEPDAQRSTSYAAQ
jgi:hypothetical protein